MTEEEALLVLNAVPGFGHRRFIKLIEYFGSAQKVFTAKPRDLLASELLTPQVITKIFEFDRDNFLQNEYNLIQRHGVKVVSIFQDDYPAALKMISDAPTVLYVRGCFPQDNGVALGMVGSRNASPYGLTTARKFSAQLAQLGITIVSGLARGIDTAAHQGCLQTGGKTVGVLGCGLSYFYPEENEALYQEIAQNGAVISEFPMATPPITYNFPGRNRIISGLSLAVLVVEASLKSGALITSSFALEQGRDVFAIPGKIDQPNSQGVNQLIKQGAKLVTSFEDILQELESQILRLQNGKYLSPRVSSVDDGCLPSGLSDEELVVAQILSSDPVYIDQLAEQSGRPFADIAGILLKLEFKKIAKQLPGQQYIRA